MKKQKRRMRSYSRACYSTALWRTLTRSQYFKMLMALDYRQSPGFSFMFPRPPDVNPASRLNVTPVSEAVERQYCKRSQRVIWDI